MSDEYWDDLPSEEELARAGYIQISRRIRLIASTPRVGQCFWVDFPRDAYAPEFEREHPGVVVRAAQFLDHDTCIIVPLTSEPQPFGRHVHKLRTNPNPKARDRDVWAVCHHLYTVNLCRLRSFKNKTGQPFYPRVSDTDLEAIFAAVRVSLHHVFGVPELPAVAAIPPTELPSKPAVEVKGRRKPALGAVSQKATPAPGKAIGEETKKSVGPSGRRILTLKKADD